MPRGVAKTAAMSTFYDEGHLALKMNICENIFPRFHLLKVELLWVSL